MWMADRQVFQLIGCHRGHGESMAGPGMPGQPSALVPRGTLARLEKSHSLRAFCLFCFTLRWFWKLKVTVETLPAFKSVHAHWSSG